MHDIFLIFYSVKGLSDEEVAERLAQYGRNALTPPKQESAWVKYFKKVAGLFNLLLILAGVLAIILYFLDSSEPVNVTNHMTSFVTIIRSTLVLS